MEDVRVGAEVDGYRILEVLGRGGMGVVYKARNLSLNRIEALKVIAPSLVQDDQFLRRFKREAQALARIHHPNIVTVYTQRHAAIGHYLTMEYVEGTTLADVLVAGQGMDWTEALPIIKQLLAAFDYAHGRGIIHRDIKPRNIMLTPDWVVKVMDFGLARFYQQRDVTQTQGVSGTLHYMSPEQIKGHSDLDQRSDLFSLGMTLYEILSGRLPFDTSGSQFSIQRAIVEDAFRAPHRFKDDLPVALSAIVMKAVEKEPEARYASAGAMRADIEAFEASQTRPAGPDAPLKAPSPALTERRRAMRWARWVVGAALMTGAAWAAWTLPGTLTAPGTDLPASERVRSSLATGGVPPSDDEPRVDALPPASSESAPDDENESAGPEDETVVADTPPSASERPPSEGQAGTPAEEGPADLGATVENPAAMASTDPSAAANGSASNGSASDGSASGALAEAGDGSGAVTSGTAPEAEPSPRERVQAEARPLQEALRRAIVQREWSRVPAPLATYYEDLLRPIYRRFEIVRVESAAGALTAEGETWSLPVTMYITYQQKGREGIKAVPIPATWVWRVGPDGPALRDVRRP